MNQAIVSGSATNYIYNALGQLVEKSGNGGTTLIVYDEAGHTLGEYTATGTLVQETVWMGDTPVATLRPNGASITVYYVHTDHLGTPRKVTRPSDNGLMWRWDPDTFGSVAPNTNPAGLGAFTYNLRFPGQYALSESGLYYNYFRSYDPNMGRYLESDPIGLGGGINTYAYVGGNPLNYSDSSGLCPDEDKCKELLDKMDFLVNNVRPGTDPQAYKGLAQRFRQHPRLPPSEIPGHAEQIDIKQRQLQKVMQDYIDSGCGDPPGYAKAYAFRAIPGLPNAAPSNPIIDQQTQQELQKGAVTAGAGGLLLLILTLINATP